MLDEGQIKTWSDVELITERTAPIIYILVKSLLIDIHWSNPIKLRRRLNANAHPLRLQTVTLWTAMCWLSSQQVWESLRLHEVQEHRPEALWTPMHNVCWATGPDWGSLLRGVQNAQCLPLGWSLSDILNRLQAYSVRPTSQYITPKSWSLVLVCLWTCCLLFKAQFSQHGWLRHVVATNLYHQRGGCCCPSRLISCCFPWMPSCRPIKWTGRDSVRSSFTWWTVF